MKLKQFIKLKEKKMAKMYIMTPDLAFEVAENDQPEPMTWMEAINCGSSIGTGWRLPTPAELKEIQRLHAKAIGNFCNEKYFTSKGYNNFQATYINFINGEEHSYVYAHSKSPLKCKVRLIKNI